MWEAISRILTSRNAVVILISILIMFVIGVFLLKKGYIKIRSKNVSIGLTEESAKLYSLFEYIAVACESYTTELCRKHDDLDVIRAKYICSRVEDVFQRAVVINHMSENNTYISTKKALVYNTVLKRSENPYFKTDEFKHSIDEFTETLIRELIKLKQ